MNFGFLCLVFYDAFVVLTSDCWVCSLSFTGRGIALSGLEFGLSACLVGFLMGPYLNSGYPRLGYSALVQIMRQARWLEYICLELSFFV